MFEYDGYNQTDDIVHKNQFHIVFCPKYRRKVLVNGVDIRLKEILLETAADSDIVLKSIEIMPDHVHLFIEIDPHQSVHMAVRALKGRTSRLLREEFPWLKSKIPSLWTRSYFSCTGDADEEAVQQYLADRKNK